MILQKSFCYVDLVLNLFFNVENSLLLNIFVEYFFFE